MTKIAHFPTHRMESLFDTKQPSQRRSYGSWETKVGTIAVHSKKKTVTTCLAFLLLSASVKYLVENCRKSPLNRRTMP